MICVSFGKHLNSLHAFNNQKSIHSRILDSCAIETTDNKNFHFIMIRHQHLHSSDSSGMHNKHGSECLELQHGVAHLSEPVEEFTRDEIDCLNSFLSFSLIYKLVDSKSCLNKGGFKIVENSDKDFQNLFSYITRLRLPRKSTSQYVSDVNVSPVIFLKTLNYLFKSNIRKYDESKEALKAHSEIVESTIFSIEESIKQDSVGKIFQNWISTIHEKYPNMIEPFSKVFQDSLRQGTTEKLLDIDIQEIHDFLIDEPSIQSYASGFFTVNTLLHYNSHNFDRADQQSLLNLNKHIGAIISCKEPSGNVLLHVNVQWNSIGICASLPKNSFIEVRYAKFREFYPMNSSLVIPISDAYSEISIRLIHYKAQVDKSSILDGKNNNLEILHSIRIVDLQNNQAESFQIRRKQNYGTISYETNFFPIGQFVDCAPRTPDIDPIALIDKLVRKMVYHWFAQTSNLSDIPPPHYFVPILEISLRYGIRSSIIFTMIAKRLLKCWCNSNTYLMSFTSIFVLACSAGITEDLLKIQKALVPKIYDSLILQFTHLGLFERNSIFPLLVLLNYVPSLKGAKTVLKEIMMIAETSIIDSVLVNLQPIEYDFTPSEALSRLLSIIPQRNVSGVNLTKLCFSHSSIRKTAEAFHARIYKICRFYDEHNIPKFANFFEHIQPKFAEITEALGIAFVSMPIIKNGPNFIPFLYAYADIWSMLQLSQRLSPYNMFKPILEECIISNCEYNLEVIQNSIKCDLFNIMNLTHRTSTSVQDLFVVLSQTFKFYDALYLMNESIEPIIKKYTEFIMKCAKLYIDSMNKLLILYFPKEIIKKSRLITIYKSFTKEEKGQKPITLPQLCIIMNNLRYFRNLWNNFIKEFQLKFGEFDSASSSINPTELVDEIPVLFSVLVGKEIHDLIIRNILQTKKIFKSIYVHRPYKILLNQSFDKKKPTFFNDLVNEIVELMKSKYDNIQTNIYKAYYKNMLKGLFVGLDVGMVNLLIRKRKSLNRDKIVKMTEYIKNIITPIMTHVQTKDKDINIQELEGLLKCAIFLNEIKDKDMNSLFIMDEHETDSQKKHLIYLLIMSSMKENKGENAENINENKYKHVYFTPIFDLQEEFSA